MEKDINGIICGNHKLIGRNFGIFYDGWLEDDISWIINFHLGGCKNSKLLDLCA